jgi:hypothetical protein
VQDSLGVNVRHSTQDFLDDDFDLFLVDFVVLIGEKFFEVVVVVVEYYFKELLLRFVDDLVKRNNVGVLLECFQERNLS